jgi:hypothetical protein
MKIGLPGTTTQPQTFFMRSLFILLLVIAGIQASAQITGQVKDGQGNLLTGTTVSLMRVQDSALIKYAVSGDEGVFMFKEVTHGSYRLTASFVGHQPFLSEIFEFSENPFRLDIVMQKLSSDLAGVVVTAKKPVVEVRADKMILNVEGTINATGSDALELLRKAPGVTVDKDENISLSGKNGVQVFIDGRPTPLAGQDLAQYLKSMQSSNIEAIELITNPSAKYEAAGNAGIINIRLKKNKALGTNGSVNAGYNIGIYSKYNTGFSLNHRNQKLNLFGNYNYNNNKNQNSLSIDRSVADSFFSTRNTIIAQSKNHNFKAGADYFINKQNTLGIIVNGSVSEIGMANNSRTSIASQTGNTNRWLVANNRSSLERNNVGLNLNYSYNHQQGKSLNLNGDMGKYELGNDQFQPNFYYDPSGQTLTSSVIYQMIAPTDISIKSLKADWEQNFAKGKLGFGGKTAFISTENDFKRYNVFNNSKELDIERSNGFNYKENINALYVNYNRAFTGFMIQGGLRAENTITEGVSNGMRHNGSGFVKYDSTFKRNYTDLFPSAAITFNKNPMSQFSVTYSRRVDRPAYQDLNPFEFKLDEYTYQKGNIDLRPQYTNSFGITHTFKYRLNTTLNYSRVKNMFVQWIDTAEISKSFITKKNLATQDIVSLNISYPFQYKSYSLFANLNANRSHYTADFGPGRQVDLNAYGLSIFAQNSLRFAKTWTAELSGFYNAPTIYQGAFQAKSMWGVDAGLQKQLFAGKATLKASVSDVFNSLQFHGKTEFAGQVSNFTSRWESQQFKISLNYRFGNTGVKAARQRGTASEEETKRVQQGGGMGIGQ